MQRNYILKEVKLTQLLSLGLNALFVVKATFWFINGWRSIYPFNGRVRIELEVLSLVIVAFETKHSFISKVGLT